jgi:adenylate cyclase
VEGAADAIMSQARKRRLPVRWDALVVVVAFLLVLPAQRAGVLAPLELQFDAFRQLLRTHVAFSDELLLVNTDEAFFDAYGSWPLRRVDLARLAVNLDALGARTVALDVLMDFPSSYGEDEPAAALLATVDPVLLVSQGVVEDGELVALQGPVAPLDAVARTGYTNLQSDSFLFETIATARIYPEATALPDGWPYAVQALALHLGVEPRLDGRTLHLGANLAIPLDRDHAFRIDFPSVAPGERSIGDRITLGALPFLDPDALDPEERAELRAWVEDRLVIVGDTSEVSHDYFETPIGTVYGVEIIAAIVDTLLRGAPLQPAGLPWEALAALLLGTAVLLTARMPRPLPRLLVTAGAYLAWAVVAVWLYAAVGVVLSMSYALLAGVVGVLAVNVRFYLDERSQKALIRDAFGQYLSPKVVSELVRDPGKLALGGENREMTAFFSDLAGFSTIAETLGPTELVALLNEYLTLMCEVIADYDGTIDKFEGDAIMGFWGAPIAREDHARLACYAAIDMQKALAGLRERLRADGRPLLFARMGLNSGEMLVGNLGSDQRMDYTVMGDAVNLASRLEGANKFYGTAIMISEGTRTLAGDAVETRELDRIRVVGKREPVTVHELLDRRGLVTGPRAELVDRYGRALAAYRDRRFDDALAGFREALAVDPDDGPSRTYVERCEHYAVAPPGADWDGVWQLDAKG